MAAFTVLYDAGVLYPAPLRDWLMPLALTDLYRARWTDQIHEEWIGNLLEQRPDLNRDLLERTRQLMNAHIRDGLVTGYDRLIEGLSLPDPDDRHVLAAAIRCGASVIVTYHVGDFPVEYVQTFSVEAQHPDDFITHLIDWAPACVCTAAKRHRASLKNPPKDVYAYLEALAKQRLPETVAKLRDYAELI